MSGEVKPPKAPQEKADQLKKLAEKLEDHCKKPQAEWPLDLMAEIHGVAKEITEVVGKELYDAMAFPNKAKCDPGRFFPGHEDSEPGFTRPQTTWVEDQGYSMHKTTYMYTDTWDRVPLTVAFYIPNNLKSGDKAPIIWYFHGGGYCTGANNFHPWFSQASIDHARLSKAIIIAPDYPLGPESNLQDIAASIKTFLEFYKQDVCFEADFDNWTKWLLSKINVGDVNGVTLRRDHVLIEGESAGGQAAATAMFINADKQTGTHLNIAAALLRFPMIEHYARHFDVGEQIKFMGKSYEQTDLGNKAETLMKTCKALEEIGYLPTRVRSFPPECMPAAFLLSVTQKWKASFQRQHIGQKKSTDPFDNMDGLERAANSVEKVDHKLLPPIYMYHGGDDSNCKWQKTKEFADILRKNYGTRYDENTVVADIVVGEQHAFDYLLPAKKHKFLQDTYKFIDKYW